MNKNSPYGRSRVGMPNQNKGLVMPPALSHMRNVMGEPMQWGGMMIPPAPSTRAQPKVQLTLQREEVNLHKAENAWKPSTLKRGSHGDQALGEEQVVIESIEKETRAILNKLTPDNFDKLVENFSQLPFEGIDGRIAGIAGMLYEKAMSSTSQEISLLALYARMVSAICSTLEKNSKQFRKHVINICQSEFEVGIPAQLKSVEASLAKAPDNKILMESKKEFRSRKFCNIRFIGELFKLDMLPSSSMMHCVQLLLRSLDEDNLDSVCKLLTCVGERLDVQTESLEKLGNSKLVSETTSMNSVFQQLEDLLLSERIKLSPRIQFAILDVVELRKNGWKPARRSDNHEVTQKQDVCQRKDFGVNLPPVQNSGDGGSQVNGGLRVNGKSHRLELLDSHTQKNREGKGILGDIGEGEGKQTLEKTEASVTSYIKSSIAEKTGQVAKVIKVVFQNAIPSQEPAAYANLLHAAYKASQCNSKQFKKGIEKQCKNELQNSMHLYENRGIRVGRFIGELYNMDILSGEFVRVIVPTLLEVKVISGKEVYLETICGILISCGKNLDKDCRSKWMKNRIRLLEELSSSRLELSPTLRSEVLKILELRKNGWKSENMSGMNIKQHENVVPEGQENYLKKESSSDQDTLIGKSQSDRANGVHTNSLTPNEAVPKEVIPETINEPDLSRSGTGTPGNRGDSAIKGKLIHTNLDLKCPFPPKSGQMTDLINEIFVDAVASSEPVTYAKMVHAVCQTSSQENCKQFKNEIALKCRHELYYSRHLRSNQKVKILRFIGELYNWNILIPEFVVGCVQSLLNPISESNLECLCEIVTICGKKLDTEVSLSRWMDARFVHLMELVDRKKVSPPVCSAIRSVIELRENQWKTQRNKDRNRTKKRGVVLGITGYPAYCWKK
ncbi:unnamed protein product [Orchesella dallaii]|uniref:MIF4G domain-containing protein n=1 Tax=Orchesella dallaii TaxID=48710 RepID=A0ABP1S9G3_9HEXA